MLTTSRPVVARLPRPACGPTKEGSQPPQRLPGARRRHGHEHGADARVGRGRARRGDMAATCKAISHGSLMGARGQLRRHPQPDPAGHGQDLRTRAGLWGRGGAGRALAAGQRGGLRRGDAAGRGNDPHRRPRRQHGEAAGDGGELVSAVLDAARTAAADALERTPDMLPVLKQAGVVDAGGAGFLAC